MGDYGGSFCNGGGEKRGDWCDVGGQELWITVRRAHGILKAMEVVAG